MEAEKSFPKPRLFGGADGFIDEIIQVVDKRFDAENYVPVKTISDYAERLSHAAGKSTNVEFVVQQVKSGGNGPLMCEAFGRLGGKIRYVGSIGWPDVDPIFSFLEDFAELYPIAPAAQTLATEFEDGKIMHGKHGSLRDVTWSNFLTRLGGEQVLNDLLAETDLLALVNWTMLPYLTEIYDGILEHLKKSTKAKPRFAFFDLCDPEKRTNEDLIKALTAIGSFTTEIPTVILGLNEKESLEICKAYQVDPGPDDHAGLLARSELIVERVGCTEVVIHPTRCAAAWSKNADSGAWDGPFCPAPKLTTGAGDHFNGGYMYARTMGLVPAKAIVIGTCVSGFYVREGRGPSPDEIRIFASRWIDGHLDPWQPIGV